MTLVPRFLGAWGFAVRGFNRLPPELFRGFGRYDEQEYGRRLLKTRGHRRPDACKAILLHWVGTAQCHLEYHQHWR